MKIQSLYFLVFQVMVLAVSSSFANSATEVRDDIYLRFTINGDGYGNERFEPVFSGRHDQSGRSFLCDHLRRGIPGELG
jgi:hypothetical protein